jgi:signal transduction histidine kinase
VVISVQDDGPGIAEANLDRLFRPFFTTREGGTGLGLANVKKIAEYHGGTAAARNADPCGAIFSICLPAGGPGEARDRDHG